MPKRRPGRHRRAEFDTPWAPIPAEVLESHAYRSLGVNALRSLARIIVEYIHEGGTENGRLIVTYVQFTRYGVTHTERAKAIEELEFKGLIRLKRGYRVGVTKTPNEYTLTFLTTFDGARPTNDWKKFAPDHDAEWKTRRKKKRRA
jgi:hypothetical protein